MEHNNEAVSCCRGVSGITALAIQNHQLINLNPLIHAAPGSSLQLMRQQQQLRLEKVIIAQQVEYSSGFQISRHTPVFTSVLNRLYNT